MPTPVGPVPRDPNDPDLWEEWDDDDAAWTDESGRPAPRFPTWVIVLGVLALVGFIAAFLFG